MEQVSNSIEFFWESEHRSSPWHMLGQVTHFRDKPLSCYPGFKGGRMRQRGWYLPPSDQSPSDQAPSDQIPSDQSPSDQIPSDQIPSDQTASEQTPSDQNPSEHTPRNQPPSDQTVNTLPARNPRESPWEAGGAPRTVGGASLFITRGGTWTPKLIHVLLARARGGQGAY
ncbi:unnamed protein product [Boreogadus saida]